jgi:hypothetical protein
MLTVQVDLISRRIHSASKAASLHPGPDVRTARASPLDRQAKGSNNTRVNPIPRGCAIRVFHGKLRTILLPWWRDPGGDLARALEIWRAEMERAQSLTREFETFLKACKMEPVNRSEENDRFSEAAA